MICFPNAKINLGLNIVAKRSDGYHDLETIFYPLGIQDALEVVSVKDAAEDSFMQRGLQIDGQSSDNLVMKALKLMRQHYQIPTVAVELLKKIPFGAGIGGGSADAAFMLKMLNDMFELNASETDLAGLARQLGADCPFFIYNRPLFASGIGEFFEEINLSLKGYYIALVKPDIHVSTKEAFSLIKPEKPSISLREIIENPVTDWKNMMKNDFESSIFPQFPEIENIKNELYDLGAVYTSMSGSGSSVYAICKEDISSSIKNEFPKHYTWVGEAGF